MNWIIWVDDAQVVRIVLEKRYSETPSALVEVTLVAGESA
jgi:Holliday junction resolvase RusA-like endonuclease